MTSPPHSQPGTGCLSAEDRQDLDAVYIKHLKDTIERLTERCAAYKGQVEAGAAEIARLRGSGVQISDDIVDRALTENVDLIQGYSYEHYHCIRDFRQDAYGREIWRCPRSPENANHGAFQKRLAHEKLKAQLIAAFASTVPSAEGK